MENTSLDVREEGGRGNCQVKVTAWEVGLLDMFKALLASLEVVGSEREWGRGPKSFRKRRGFELENPSWSFTAMLTKLRVQVKRGPDSARQT